MGDRYLSFEFILQNQNLCYKSEMQHRFYIDLKVSKYQQTFAEFCSIVLLSFILINCRLELSIGGNLLHDVCPDLGQ